MRIVEETIKYEIPKNNPFTLGTLIKSQKRVGYKLDNVLKGKDFEYPIFVRKGKDGVS